MELRSHLDNLQSQADNDVDWARYLYSATRLTILLGRPDEALPLNRELMTFRLDTGDPLEDVPDLAYKYLLMIGWLLGEEGRWSDALDLDREANTWFGNRRATHEDSFIESTIYVARDLAMLGDFDEADAALTRAIDDRSGSTRRPFSPNSRRLQKQRAKLRQDRRRQAKRDQHREGF